MRIVRYSAVVLVAILACSSAARGGLLAIDGSDAYNDGTMVWCGSQSYVKSFFGVNLNVTVDYAVYAPGHFDNSFLGNPTDPSGGNDYVYAYQLWDNFPQSNAGVTTFTVGFTNADGGGPFVNKFPANIGDVMLSSDSTGMAPPSPSSSSEVFQYQGGLPTSAVWSYGATPSLPIGSHSDILIYTSPYPPHFDSATIQGGVALSEPLPSPVPEPASGLLLSVAAVSLLAFRVVCRPRAGTWSLHNKGGFLLSLDRSSPLCKTPHRSWS